MPAEKIVVLSETPGVYTSGRILPEVGEALARLNRVVADSAYPDEENDLPVSAETARAAKQVIEESAYAALENGVEWLRPSLSPPPDGTILISWRRSGYSFSLMAQAERDLVTVSKQPSQEPQRQVKFRQEALSDIVIFLLLYSRQCFATSD